MSSDQSAQPIAEALAAYRRDDRLSFSIPAHAGGRGPLPEFARWAGLECAHHDLPMSHGVDRRDRSWEVQSRAQELFAEAVGAKEVLFSTNGSSMNVHVALLAVGGEGRTIVMARNGHKSMIAGLVLSGAHPVYVDPYYDEDLELAHVVRADAVAAALDAHPEAAAAFVMSPSFYGTAADIRALADAAHARGVPLVTDDAWGLDSSFRGDAALPESALAQGADLSIGSVHKTLTGLTQTSVLSVGSDRIDVDRLKLCFELQESTSASALLLGSIDSARAQFVREGGELLKAAIAGARHLRERLEAEVPELQVVDPEVLLQRPGVATVDPTHVLIETASVGLTGYEADDWLLDHHGIDLELMDHRRVQPIVTWAHGEAEVDRLVRALRELVDRRGGDPLPRVDWPSRQGLRTEQALRPRDAFFAPAESVDARKAIGRVSAELVTPYPPGIPVLAPGEVVTAPIVDYFEGFVALGGFVEGAADQTLETLRVVSPA